LLLPSRADRHLVVVARVANHCHAVGVSKLDAQHLRCRATRARFIYEEIALRRKEPDVAERDDVLSLLLGTADEYGRPMTDQELRDDW